MFRVVFELLRSTCGCTKQKQREKGGGEAHPKGGGGRLIKMDCRKAA